MIFPFFVLGGSNGKNEQAVATFNDGYNCFQAVFSTFAAVSVQKLRYCIEAINIFGDGIARHGEA